jgi:multidrug resistance efflux pump
MPPLLLYLRTRGIYSGFPVRCGTGGRKQRKDLMATAFSHTIKALRADSFRNSIAVVLFLVVLFIAWLSWFFFAKVTRYEVTDHGRLEVDQEINPIQSPVLGRVVSSNLALGKPVHAGDVLLELDAGSEQLEVKEEKTQLAALDSEVASLRAQAAALKQAAEHEAQTTEVAVEEASDRYREADALARLAGNEARRLEKLHAENLVPEREYEQGKLEAERRQSAAEGLRLEAGRLTYDQRTRASERTAQMSSLLAQINKLEGAKTTAGAAIDRLSYEVERRVIRSPVNGTIAEVSPLRPGAVIAEGERLGAILPEGRMRVVAEFAPPEALGRIRPGQPAQVRLEGFSWTEYGTISARVSTVADEVRNGTVRVELKIIEKPAVLLPVQHGLPGSVEVEVERVSPAVLALRSAGRMITTPGNAAASKP